MPWYLCPANPNEEINELAVTHYVGCAGLGSDAVDLTIADPAAGVFGYERLTKLTDISDGPATPIMVLETMRENGPWIAGGRPTVRGLIRDDQPYLGVARQFGGAHRGITVVLFADGSIRAIRDSIDPRTLEALATIAASDSIGQYTTD